MILHASMIDDIKWIALNVYHESRGEPINGQIMVALTTLNRVKDSRFPNNVKGVVQQKNQFSWFNNNNKSYEINDIVSWNKSICISIFVMLIYDHIDLINVMWYHNDTVNPIWTNKLFKVMKIGKHNFYVE